MELNEFYQQEYGGKRQKKPQKIEIEVTRVYEGTKTKEQLWQELWKKDNFRKWVLGGYKEEREARQLELLEELLGREGY